MMRHGLLYVGLQTGGGLPPRKELEMVDGCTLQEQVGGFAGTARPWRELNEDYASMPQKPMKRPA